VSDERHAINTIAEAPTNPTQRRTSDQNTPWRARPWSSVQTPTVRTRPGVLGAADGDEVANADISGTLAEHEATEPAG
jgi:hypothetical protein